MLHQALVPNSGKAIATRLVADAEASLEHDLARAKACLRQLASLLAVEEQAADESDAPEAEPQVVRGGLAPWQVRRVAAYVDSNLGEPVSVTELAAVAKLSKGYFCRAFKATMGLTPHTYIVRRRIERAQILMLTTSDTLSQIASICGLTDQAHLTRLFRRFVGQTPHNWRRTWRQRF